MPQKPHLIIIMADQLRADALGEHTPHINQLFAESTRFDQAYTACPLCVPARGAFFTGQYPNTTGSRINPWDQREYAYGLVKKGFPNLYTLLENDWDSWHTGKQHLFTEEDFEHSPDSKTHWFSIESGYDQYLQANNIRRPGGDRFSALLPELVAGRFTKARKYSIPETGCYEPGFDYFTDGYITQTSLDAIQQRDKNKPFLLNAMYLAPHPPFDIPEPWYSRVKEVNLPENVGLWSQGQSPLQLYNLPGFFGIRYSREQWEGVWKVYQGLVSLLDDCVGMLVDALKKEGLYDDAIILFTADHGEMLGSHCLWQKMCMYEEATHIPLAIKLPKGQPFISQSNELVSLVDVLPTLCDLLDVTSPPDLPGISLTETIHSGAPAGREHVFIQFDGNGARGNFQRCIVKDQHKLIIDLFQNEVYFELYNLRDDPQEKFNLAFQEKDLTVNLLDELISIMHETRDALTITQDDYEVFCDAYVHYIQEPYYPLGIARK